MKHRWLSDGVWVLYLYRNEYGQMGVNKYVENEELPNLGKIQVKFTLKEIEEIKENFDTDLKDFKKIEVKDED